MVPYSSQDHATYTTQGHRRKELEESHRLMHSSSHPLAVSRGSSSRLPRGRVGAKQRKFASGIGENTRGTVKSTSLVSLLTVPSVLELLLAAEAADGPADDPFDPVDPPLCKRSEL